MDNFRIEGAGFAQVSRALNAVDKELRTAMFTELREAAQPVVDDMKRSVQSIDSKGNAIGRSSAERAAHSLRNVKKVTEKKAANALGRAGLRASIARAVHIKIADKGWKVGVRVRVDGTKLPAAQKYLPRGLDSASGWRHPIFGTDKWAQQYGNPPGWFTSTAKAHRPLVRRRIERIVANYANELVARIKRAA